MWNGYHLTQIYLRVFHYRVKSLAVTLVATFWFSRLDYYQVGLRVAVFCPGRLAKIFQGDELLPPLPYYAHIEYEVP